MTRSFSFALLLLCCVGGNAFAVSDCRSLKGLAVPAGEIGLPTTGAGVKSAKLIHDGPADYCRVLGGIRPVDPQAQEIRFEVNLPERWNGKAVQFGGGAFDGYLKQSDGRARTVVSDPTQPTPLARGFATFGSDSGHHKHYLLLPDILNALNASFALNTEERVNYAYDGIKKTHDVAVRIMQARYGKPPARMYFLGGSTGGREAYFAVQKWPADYDGVLGAYAGWDQVELDLQLIRVSQAMYAKGGFLPKAKTRLLARSVMGACDGLDGASDGIISNPEACRFDPKTLACPAGKDGKGCLTEGELKTVETFATEQRTAMPLLHGVETMPGYNVLSGTDLTGSMGFLHHPLHPPIILLNSFYYVIGDGVLRFFLTRDRKFDALTFDTKTGGKFGADLLPQSIASDASDADISAFERRGGKFLMLHGTTDATIPTGASILYYNMLQKQFPQTELDSFVRFYLVPGYGHGRGVFNAGFDALGVLDRWVEAGEAPQGLVATDGNKQTRGRSRPLCDYPTWPRYVQGDVNLAASFTCVR